MTNLLRLTEAQEKVRALKKKAGVDPFAPWPNSKHSTPYMVLLYSQGLDKFRTLTDCEDYGRAAEVVMEVMVMGWNETPMIVLKEDYEVMNRQRRSS